MGSGWRSGGLVLGCLAVLGGCGSSASSHAARTRTGATSSLVFTRTTSSTTAAAGGEAGKPPQQILADAASAVRASHGYALQGTITQNHQRTRLSVASTSLTSLKLALAAGDLTTELIAVPSGSYVRGNAAFWRSLGGCGAACQPLDSGSGLACASPHLLPRHIRAGNTVSLPGGGSWAAEHRRGGRDRRSPGDPAQGRRRRAWFLAGCIGGGRHRTALSAATHGHRA